MYVLLCRSVAQPNPLGGSHVPRVSHDAKGLDYIIVQSVITINTLLANITSAVLLHFSYS